MPFKLAPEEPVLGRRLRLQLPTGTREVRIVYETSPDALGLQWLAPEQTAGGRHPFLFSQCGPAGDSPGPAAGTRTFRFEMPQPIPSYLLALAVGRLESRDLSLRSRVWAEPETLPAHEFAEIEGMIARAEALFGPYEWDRYDMLVLPPSFPYGGMENPRMTFLTPTLIAGDRSLVDVVVHELAHSWTGNLVTNATIDHFWLNDERRGATRVTAIPSPQGCRARTGRGDGNCSPVLQNSAGGIPATRGPSETNPVAREPHRPDKVMRMSM